LDVNTAAAMTLSSPIPLPFVPESVARVLAWGASPDAAPYSHKQVAEWCDAFWCCYLEVDAPAEIERLLPLLTDVETQWDLYLANTYSLDQLRTRSFESERMPTEWFEEWLKALEAQS
jgi:hypothetical protein